MKLLFAVELTENSGQTLEGGAESESGDETTAKKVITFQRTMTKKGRQSFREK